MRKKIALRGALAALYATAAASTVGAAPAPKEIDRLLDVAAGRALSPAKRALLLGRTLARSDISGVTMRLPSERVADFGSRSRAVGAPDDLTGQARLAGALHTDHLDAMSEGMWETFVPWLLAQDGFVVERLPGDQTPAVWRADKDGASVVASAHRGPVGWHADEMLVQRAAEHARAVARAAPTLLTTARLTVGGREAARRLGVCVIDRPALHERLALLATSHQREAVEAEAETLARVAAARAARTALLASLQAMEAIAGGSADAATTTARDRRRVAAGTEQARAALNTFERALLAWETLLAEWGAAFADRPTRAGTLVIDLDGGGLRALAARGEHLGLASVAALHDLTRAPARGELGYTAWRQTVREYVLLRCGAMRLRVEAIDPAQWQRFADAHHDDLAQAAADQAVSADHAAARASKAYATLAARAGLAEA